METKNQSDVVYSKLEFLKDYHSLLVPPHGVGGGGLALFWKAEMEMDIISSNDNYIDTRIKFQRASFLATFVYGEPDQSKRSCLWANLVALGEDREEPWFLSGDFNEILDNSEKQGGPERPERSFVEFRFLLSECGLFDLKHTGNFLSWRGVRHSHLVKCRLDRAMANSACFELFSKGRCEYLRFEGSDHRPILSYLGKEKKKKKGLFRYDRRLKGVEEIIAIIKVAWNEDPSLSLEDRLSACRREIVLWTREAQRNSQAEIVKLRERLEKAMVSLFQDEPLISQINLDLNAAYLKEEEFWKQRSRLNWLALGDQNSGFFHAVTKGRSCINNLPVMEDENGAKVFEDSQIADLVSKCYQDLFTSQSPESSEVSQIVEDAISPKVSDEDNSWLILIPSSQEVKEAVFDIHPDKAPGPDGFSASFFQSNWDIVGEALVKEVQSYFISGSFPASINKTFIRLIPKIKGAKRVLDYRPIALCNVTYKIFSKILTKRLKTILSPLISENQSAFVASRAISDNVLIAHETLHYLKVSGAKKNVSLVVKTDMSKAYDRLEWSFIQAVLQRKGFHPTSIEWTMQCVKTVSYSFLINGSPMGDVVPSRGIRQGDPLSPYLFILCGDVLSGLCDRSQREGKLQGIRVATRSPRINHLLFADDTLFSAKPRQRTAEN